MDFRSGVVLHLKQAYNVRVLALSEKPRNACSKDEGRTAEVRGQESRFKSQESGVKSQESGVRSWNKSMHMKRS